MWLALNTLFFKVFGNFSQAERCPENHAHRIPCGRAFQKNIQTLPHAWLALICALAASACSTNAPLGQFFGYFSKLVG